MTYSRFFVLGITTAMVACSSSSSFEPNYTPTPVFTNPTNITNPFLPFSGMQRDVLTGTEGGKASRVVRTNTGTTKAFTFNGQPLLALIMIDSAFANDTLVEVATDYFAQSDAGDVYYFGEDVNNYAPNGTIANHEGSWLFGVNTTVPGLFISATPSVGQKFRSEDVPGITREEDEIISISDTVTVGTGHYSNCVKIKEILSDGGTEYKLYASGVGIVKEISEDGAITLQTHN
ncbi:MAG TPA: hypothetical protein VKD28_18965 [Gemmatimonadales bacterium]|nr:hypothetical protein [Gemmatimonadales bacterium]